MLTTNKMAEVAKELQIDDLDITAVHKIRWRESEKISKERYIFLYSGKERKGNDVISTQKRSWQTK